MRLRCFILIWQRHRPADSTWSSSDDRDTAATVKCLQERLKQEMEEHIRGNSKVTQQMLTWGDSSEDVHVSQMNRG